MPNDILVVDISDLIVAAREFYVRELQFWCALIRIEYVMKILFASFLAWNLAFLEYDSKQKFSVEIVFWLEILKILLKTFWREFERRIIIRRWRRQRLFILIVVQ